MKQWRQSWVRPRHSWRPATRGICRTESTQMMIELILTNIHSECLMMSGAIMTHSMATRLKFKLNVAVSCNDIIKTAYRTLCLSMLLSHPLSHYLCAWTWTWTSFHIHPTISATYSLLLYGAVHLHTEKSEQWLCCTATAPNRWPTKKKT